MSKTADAMHPITKKLSKLVTNRTIVEPRNKKKDKEKKFDESDKPIVNNSENNDAIKELNDSNFEEENESENDEK